MVWICWWATGSNLESGGSGSIGAVASIFNTPEFNSGRLHYIVLDTAPSAGGLQEMALYAADIIVLSAAVDYLGLEGVAQILQTIKSLKRPHPPLVRIQPTFFDEVTKESAINLTGLQKQFGQVVLDPIHRAVALRECPPLGKTIFDHRPNCRAATEYANLVWEVINAGSRRPTKNPFLDFERGTGG